MKDFLDDYFVTLSGKRLTSIHSLLSEARVSKGDLDKVIDKLRDFKKDAPLVLAKEAFGSLIKSDTFDNAKRDGLRRLKELFETSNNISTVLESYKNILSSEIKSLEDDLIAIEKSIDNYAFTLADNGFFDYAFLETFNDDTMKETDLPLRKSDRSGVDFADSEIAVVNGGVGLLSLSPTLSSSYPMNGFIINNNCMGYATSSSGVFKALNDDVGDGWRVAMSTIKPFSSKLYSDLTKVGAQIELEIHLAAPSPCDSINLVPFAEIPVDLMRVTIFDDSSDDGKKTIIHNEPLTMDRIVTLNFPLQVVSKFRIVLSQSVYKRGEVPPAQYEVTYRDFYNEIKDNRERVVTYMGKSALRNKKAFNRVFLKSLKKNNPNMYLFKAQMPELDFDPTFGPFTIDKIVKGFDASDPKKDIWRGKSKVTTFMRKMIDERIFNGREDIMHGRFVSNADRLFLSRNSPLQTTMISGRRANENVLSAQQPTDASIISYPTMQESTFLNYQYAIGLRNIKIGVSNNSYRGVFVSKQIPCPSDSGEVKIKVKDTNYQIADELRDSSIITSIEYSVSNKSTPVVEQDWISILPINQDIVEAERLFLNEIGLAKLRFPASANDVFEIYKNGFKLDLTNVVKQFTSDRASITSVQIPYSLYSSSDIFTINYKPFGDCSIVKFAYNESAQGNLASAFDNNGAGETFSSTLNNQTVSLKNDPYIDYEQIELYGDYSTTYGFTGTYQPITIVMADGTTALNQTNYKGIIQNSLATFDETKTAFIHSGKNIIFNKPITESFTVYYQYLPSNLRFRIVLRVNDINYVSPTVDSIQLKTKTRKANPRRII